METDRCLETIDGNLPESDFDFEPQRCPICGVINLPDLWQDDRIGSICVRGQKYRIAGETFAHGTGCWDSPFGDECGACLNTVINTETALIGPNGYCHA